MWQMQQCEIKDVYHGEKCVWWAVRKFKGRKMRLMKGIMVMYLKELIFRVKKWEKVCRQKLLQSGSEKE